MNAVGGSQAQSPGQASQIWARVTQAWRPLFKQADAARDRHNWALAADLYMRALAINPRLANVWVQYGHVLKEGGNRHQAETAYRKALSLRPDSSDIHLQLGHVLKLIGNIDGAAAAYLRAFELDPANGNAGLELEHLVIHHEMTPQIEPPKCRSELLLQSDGKRCAIDLTFYIDLILKTRRLSLDDVGLLHLVAQLSTSQSRIQFQTIRYAAPEKTWRIISSEALALLNQAAASESAADRDAKLDTFAVMDDLSELFSVPANGGILTFCGDGGTPSHAAALRRLRTELSVRLVQCLDPATSDPGGFDRERRITRSLWIRRTFDITDLVIFRGGYDLSEEGLDPALGIDRGHIKTLRIAAHSNLPVSRFAAPEAPAFLRTGAQDTKTASPFFVVTAPSPSDQRLWDLIGQWSAVRNRNPNLASRHLIVVTSFADSPDSSEKLAQMQTLQNIHHAPNLLPAHRSWLLAHSRANICLGPCGGWFSDVVESLHHRQVTVAPFDEALPDACIAHIEYLDFLDDTRLRPKCKSIFEDANYLHERLGILRSRLDLADLDTAAATVSAMLETPLDLAFDTSGRRCPDGIAVLEPRRRYLVADSIDGGEDGAVDGGRFIVDEQRTTVEEPSGGAGSCDSIHLAFRLIRAKAANMRLWLFVDNPITAVQVRIAVNDLDVELLFDLPPSGRWLSCPIPDPVDQDYRVKVRLIRISSTNFQAPLRVRGLFAQRSGLSIADLTGRPPGAAPKRIAVGFREAPQPWSCPTRPDHG